MGGDIKSLAANFAAFYNEKSEAESEYKARIERAVAKSKTQSALDSLEGLAAQYKDLKTKESEVND